MLLLHEVHTVAGRHEDEFEAAFRDGWMPTLGRDDDARLLYFLKLAHGTGRAYHLVTITALRDGAAYERLATRVQRGDLRSWVLAGTNASPSPLLLKLGEGLQGSRQLVALLASLAPW